VTFDATQSEATTTQTGYTNDVYVGDFVNNLLRLFFTPQSLGSVQQSGNPNLSLTQSGFPPAPQSGNVSIHMTLQGSPLATVQESVRSGVVPQPTIHFTTSGVAAALALTQPAPIQVKATFTPKGGKPLTLNQTIYYVPSQASATGSGATGATGATPSITGVQFHGSASNPTIVITGQNLGTEPPASPTGHVSGQNGCPAFTDDQGYDYGTNLYITLPGGVSGGRYRPEMSETDCVDLVVTKFTSTEVDFTFGSFYSQQYPKYALSAGGPYQVVVNGATYGGTVTYS
jgi:hypothetical protein